MLFRQLALVAASGVLTSAAMAHTQYVVPFNFATEKDVATLQAAAAEDFFVPDHAIKGDFVLTGPDGKSSKIAAVTAFQEVTIIEASTPDKGTYKISTSSDRAGKQALVDGKWVAVRPAAAPAPANATPAPAATPANAPAGTPPARRFLTEADLKPGTEVIATNSNTQAVSYVTRGAPSNTVLKPTGKGLELDFKTHPNDIYLDQGFSFVVLLNGQPAPNATFSLHRAGVKGDSKTVQSDANGVVNIKFEQAGAYLLEGSYPTAPADPAAKPLSQRYNYTLSFEVSQ